MAALPYLVRLHQRLADGLAAQDEDFRSQNIRFFKARQNPDGGFSGREGSSDLYYTGFALRGLAVLGGLTGEVSSRAGGFLTEALTQQASVVDFFSLLYSCVLVGAGGGPDVFAASPPDWVERVTATLETFRTSDQGYGKSVGTASGSTYHTFLVALSYEILGKAMPRAEDVLKFVHSRQREDGGFVEIAPMRRGGTNPTAAAIGVMQLLGTVPEETKTAVIDFLLRMPSMEGGFRANERTPLADLLSTFTALWTLSQLDALERVNQDETMSYARSLAVPTGGFRGGLWDNVTDVEYSFYGLGTVALLSIS